MLSLYAKKNEIAVGYMPRIDTDGDKPVVKYDEVLFVTKNSDGTYSTPDYTAVTLDILYTAIMTDVGLILKSKPGAFEKFIKIVLNEKEKYDKSFVKFIQKTYEQDL